MQARTLCIRQDTKQLLFWVCLILWQLERFFWSDYVVMYMRVRTFLNKGVKPSWLRKEKKTEVLLTCLPTITANSCRVTRGWSIYLYWTKFKEMRNLNFCQALICPKILSEGKRADSIWSDAKFWRQQFQFTHGNPPSRNLHEQSLFSFSGLGRLSLRSPWGSRSLVSQVRPRVSW